MRSLLDFLVRHVSAFLFILLEGLSLFLLFGMDDSRSLSFMTSAGNLSGGILSVRTSIGSYFSLKDENARLVNENAMLHDIVEQMWNDSIASYRSAASAPEFNVLARVIDNSVRKDDNFITIDRGKVDGIEDGMGVYDSKGVVGVVMITGERNSIVLPVLNSRTSISCKVGGTANFGFLEWDGGSPYMAVLKDIPYQSQVNRGDTVITSGFSQAFPENTVAGFVERVEHRQNDHTLDISVRLAADMTDLDWVYVHTRKDDPELEELDGLLKQQKTK